MKPICKRLSLFALSAGLIAPCFGDTITLAPATITTSLTQCEVQVGTPCVDPPTAGYTGTLAGFSTETVGTGASLSASGFSSPILTSDVPTSVANAIVDGNLEYLLEVVPTTGASGAVELGVNSTGSISINTTGNSNDATFFSGVQLQLSSDSSGTVVFNDDVNVVYQTSLNNNGSCTVSNASTATSTIAGVATVSASPNCGGSTASGGFDDTNSYSIQTGAVYLVTMQTDLSIGSDNGGDLNIPVVGGGTVQGIATVDPIFSVPTGYELVFSSGVGNSLPTTTATPEPRTWAILAAGMVLLIAAKQRHARAGQAGARSR